MLTDHEIIATFMEPLPNTAPGFHTAWSTLKPTWWEKGPSSEGVMFWVPIPLTLDALHEVEARLTVEQWSRYEPALGSPYAHKSNPITYWKALIHATAEEKIRALAAVLRAAVEGAKP